MMKNDIVLIRFETTESQSKVLQGRINHFNCKPFIVKAWSPKLEFTKESLSVPIKIKMPGLHFKYLSAKRHLILVFW